MLIRYHFSLTALLRMLLETKAAPLSAGGCRSTENFKYWGRYDVSWSSVQLINQNTMTSTLTVWLCGPITVTAPVLNGDFSSNNYRDLLIEVYMLMFNLLNSKHQAKSISSVSHVPCTLFSVSRSCIVCMLCPICLYVPYNQFGLLC